MFTKHSSLSGYRKGMIKYMRGKKRENASIKSKRIYHFVCECLLLMGIECEHFMKQEMYCIGMYSMYINGEREANFCRRCVGQIVP